MMRLGQSPSWRELAESRALKYYFPMRNDIVRPHPKVLVKINARLFQSVRERDDPGHLDKLFGLGGDPMARDGQGRTLLMIAASLGREACVSRLIRICYPRARSASRSTALIEAALMGEAGCLGILLPVSNPLARREDGLTALLAAAMAGCEKSVEVLLPASRPLIMDAAGMTPLMAACRSGSEVCVKALLPVSDLGALDDEGWDARAHAVASGAESVISLLPESRVMRSERLAPNGGRPATRRLVF